MYDHLSLDTLAQRYGYLEAIHIILFNCRHTGPQCVCQH